MKESGTTIMLTELSQIQGMSISRIARETGMSRNTIRKYLANGYQPHRSVGQKKPSKLDPYKPHLENLMQTGVFNCNVLHARISALGYDGGKSILKAYIQTKRPPAVKAGAATPRYETEPGRQAQMDWGILKYQDTDGAVRKVAAFAMVLGHSRMRYMEFSRRCDERSLLRCMTNAFLYFGGIPATVLTDRMKTVLVSMDHGKAVWQEAFERFAEELGFIPKVCRSRRPQTKGKVERLVRYIRENFMAGREFTDFGDLQIQGIAWCDQVNCMVHGTTGATPRSLLRTERLKAFPDSGDCFRYLREPRKVSVDCFVSFNGVRYGVNWRHSGERVEVAQMGEEVLVTDRDGLVLARHPVCHQPGRYLFVKDQYAGLPEQEGKPYTPAYGRRIPLEQVEIRPLTVYAALAGGDS